MSDESNADMCDESDAYWQSLHERLHQIVAKSSTQPLSREKEAELLSEYESILAQLRSHSKDRREKMAILFWLMNRQGTVMPDFDALYRRKAEMDRKLSNP